MHSVPPWLFRMTAVATVEVEPTPSRSSLSAGCCCWWFYLLFSSLFFSNWLTGLNSREHCPTVCFHKVPALLFLKVFYSFHFILNVIIKTMQIKKSHTEIHQTLLRLYITVQIVIQNGSCGVSHCILYFCYWKYFCAFIHHRNILKDIFIVTSYTWVFCLLVCVKPVCPVPANTRTRYRTPETSGCEHHRDVRYWTCILCKSNKFS